MAESASPSQRPRWRRWLGDVLLVVAVVAGVSLWQSRSVISGAAPDLTGMLTDGRTTSLAQVQAENPGKPVLVHFWATWCPICKLEEDSVAAIATEQPVLTVAMQSGTATQVENYLRERGMAFPAVQDPDGRLAAAWGISGVPASLVVDAAGNIRFREVGLTSGWGLRARLWWARVAP